MQVCDLVEGIEASRRHFFRHLAGMDESMLKERPVPHGKTGLETLAHLIVDDLAALESLQTGDHPSYEAHTESIAGLIDKGKEALLTHLAESHGNLCDYLRETFAGSNLDEEICVWGAMMPIGRGIPYFSSEDFYHAGQLAMIRTALDPEWDYYGHIYG